MRTDTIVAIAVAFTFGVLVDQEFNDPLKHGCLPSPVETVTAPAPGPAFSAAACAHAVTIGQPWRCT